MLWGLGAGGNAGNASLPGPLPGPLDAGLLVGGVGLADVGFELGAEEADETHGTVETFVLVRFVIADAVGGGGSPGKGLEDETSEEAVPHDRVWETEEREDWAVEDLSFKTRVDFAAEGAEGVGLDVEVTVAQPRVSPPLGMTLGPGREG